MTANRWTQVRTVFQDALEQPAPARAAFISAACSGDEVMRAEIESLLAAHADADGFMERPALRLATDALAAPVLAPGDRIERFDVIDVLGSGGMGEVYRARDINLGREVAIKVLPRSVANDPQRLARFERESRILAALNHPNIAAIHSIEQAGDTRFLVLELVEGPTLADRLRDGPLPIDEARTRAVELAHALEAAHDKAVVHRDLKPANLKLTASSGIKLLDFGIAKELGPDRSAGTTGIADATMAGLIFGTCSYMSPEQARGRPVDKRADIWAFGCVLFEMLSGRRAFGGDTPSDTIAAVLEREPDWSCLPANTPQNLLRVMRRCLEKDPDDRLHDIADARIEIEDGESLPEIAREPMRRPSYMRTVTVAAALCAAAIAAGWWIGRGNDTDGSASRITRFTWTLPDGLGLDSPPTVSPDGRLIAFTARSGTGGTTQLYVRPLDDLAPRSVAGTDGAKQPFWSPDGRSLGYFAGGKLMKVAVDEGAPVEICAAPDGRGGAWSPRGMIVFSPNLIESGLMQVSENGGTAEPATLLDTQQGENSHRWPVFLPDGIHFLYFVRAIGEERRGVYLGRVDRPASTPGTPLFRSESEALYAPLDDEGGGVLLTVANGRLETRPFDARTHVVTGDPRTIDVAAGGNTLYHASMLSVSADVLTFTGASIPFGSRLASIGRNGEGPTLSGERGTQGWARVSPDGSRLVRTRIDAAPGRSDLWVEDLVRGSRVRILGNPLVILPAWAPHGDRLAYVAGSVRKGAVTIARADGTGVISTVPCPAERCDVTDWSPDGRWLLANVYRERDQDVWMLPVNGDSAARPLLVQPFPERDARLSPDGRLVAYVSNETERPEISVQSIVGLPRREVISIAGGDQPVWNRNGRELFFVDAAGRLRGTAVSMRPDGRPIFGVPVLLDVPPIGSGHRGTEYDVSPDGGRIYYFNRELPPPPSEFGVVVGWRNLLK